MSTPTFGQMKTRIKSLRKTCGMSFEEATLDTIENLVNALRESDREVRKWKKAARVASDNYKEAMFPRAYRDSQEATPEETAQEFKKAIRDAIRGGEALPRRKGK